MSKYLKIKPDSAVAYKLQGQIYEKLNKPDLALESYHQSIHLANKKQQSKRKMKDHGSPRITTRSSVKSGILKSPKTPTKTIKGGVKKVRFYEVRKNSMFNF